METSARSPSWRSRTRWAMCAASVSALKRLAQHHGLDRLLHDLLEARHVRALLLRVEVHEALELGMEELVRVPIRITF